MFITKREKEEIEFSLDTIRGKIKRMEERFAECEVCGSIVFAKEENQNGKKIVTKTQTHMLSCLPPVVGKVDVIENIYYCKLHKPKSKKKKET